jgi:ribosome modulation factor
MQATTPTGSRVISEFLTSFRLVGQFRSLRSGLTESEGWKTGLCVLRKRDRCSNLATDQRSDLVATFRKPLGDKPKPSRALGRRRRRPTLERGTSSGNSLIGVNCAGKRNAPEGTAARRFSDRAHL